MTLSADNTEAVVVEQQDAITIVLTEGGCLIKQDDKSEPWTAHTIEIRGKQNLESVIAALNTVRALL